MKFKDKVALVTGSSRGIGKAIALELARGGANIIINSSKTSEVGEKVVEEIKKLGRDAIFIKCDVSKEEQVKKMISEGIKNKRIKGTIINISSTNGINCFSPDSMDYDISKAGINLLTKDLAIELAPNIRVNCVAPGWVDTDMNADLPKDFIKKEIKKIYLGRFAKPQEIAKVVSFLASDDASFITGEIIKVDG